LSVILNLHRLRSDNIGDRKASPFDYFDVDGWTVRRHDLLDAVEPEFRAEWEASYDAADCVVLGGGGLLSLDYFAAALEETYRRRRSNQKLVVWGAGHNRYDIGAWSQMRHHVDLLPYNYDLIALRDADQIYDWAPCASCMDPAFDRFYEITEDVVLYKHVETELNDYVRGFLPKNIRILDNYADFNTVIAHLGSAEVVLTSSFHGAYWASLLGRRVVAFPFSSKFYGLRHPAPLCDIRDWSRFAKLARCYPEALEECREANVRFHRRFLQQLT
jgi:hypothetical protein